MRDNEFGRLRKIEERIYQIITEEMGLKCKPVEFDVIPPLKMMEIMAYRFPTQISNWKFGRDFERIRTIIDNYDPSLPYEVVLNDTPARAYLMNSNTLAVQSLVIAHVYGHVNFYTENRWFQKARSDVIALLSEAAKRFNEYERVYGRDEIEKVVDAGHALQWHASPLDGETEDEKRERVFLQKKMLNKPDISEFGDMIKVAKQGENIEAYNMKLWRELKEKSPVEPQPDLLRYIIDNSPKLDDWQKDILETLRSEGQYFHPSMKTKYMNEGWATLIHERVMDQLFKEGLLSQEEHGQYNYSNSLVKAKNPFGMNPYLVGSEVWKEIFERWDKGRYGPEWDECDNAEERENWDTKEGKGEEKIREVRDNYSDWFFIQEYLTVDLINELELYLYLKERYPGIEIDIRTGHKDEEIRDIIISSFANSGVPLIEIVNGNFNNQKIMVMEHRWNGLILEPQNANNTMFHILYLWGNPVALKTKYGEFRNEVDVMIMVPRMPKELAKRLMDEYGIPPQLEKQRKPQLRPLVRR